MLTKTHLLTFANNNELKNPTEVIEMSQCSTVKSADDETGKTNSFVSTNVLRIIYFLEKTKLTIRCFYNLET